MCHSATRKRNVRICSLLGREYSKNWLASLGREHTNHSKATLLRLAQKLAHHGPLLPEPHPQASNSSMHSEQNCSISPKMLHCHIEMDGGSLRPTDTLHLAWEVTNSREVGAAQPEGNYLEISSWDLTTTVHFTTDVASLSHHPSSFLASLSHSSHQSHCLIHPSR